MLHWQTGQFVEVLTVYHVFMQNNLTRTVWSELKMTLVVSVL